MKKLIFIILIIFYFSVSWGQVPNPALIGYWQNWEDPNSPYIPLTLIDSRYNIINIAFAVPKPPEDYDIEFIPVRVDSSTLISQIKFLQFQGKKVIISIGGGNSPVILNNEMEKTTFINSVNNVINTYGFDGIDIDLEQNSLYINGGTISNPVDKPVQYMIEAIKQIMSDYARVNGRRLILTMAPETAHVQGGIESFTQVWGAYLPVIDALRDSIEILHIQLYNSGTMTGIDGNTYDQGTADFIVAMTEAVIQGFNTDGGYFTGMPESKIAIGLPACISAAGGGFTDTSTVRKAIEYLKGKGEKPGIYTLFNQAGYPGLRGMMTWSINWDMLNTCHSPFEYAESYMRIFNPETNVEDENYYIIDNNEKFIIPNPVNENAYISYYVNEPGNVMIDIYNSLGNKITTLINEEQNVGLQSAVFNGKVLPQGMYFYFIHIGKNIMSGKILLIR